MGKILLIVAILVFVFFVTFDVYAQTGEEGLAVSQLRGFSQYDPTNLSGQKPTLFSSDFLKMVNTEGQAYADSPMEKGGVGTINAITSWTAVPKEIMDTSEKDNILAGITYGASKGFIMGIVRGVCGLYDIATFGFPPYDQPAVKPEYKVKSPQHDGLKITLFRW